MCFTMNLGIRAQYSALRRLNPNETVRNAASAHAALLSDALSQISKNMTFKHFDTAFIPFPLAFIAEEWEKQGGQASDLIEPVDGTVVCQPSSPLLAQ